MNHLHIINGDATLNGFNQTGLDGDVLVWREVFSEGPLAVTLDAEFWSKRAEFVAQTFKDAPGNYQEMILQELEKLSEPYDDITLWFEFDLHCQVNLLGIMQLLQQHVDLSVPQIYLVCPDDFPDVTNFKGMGQLNGEQLESLYDNRLHLTDYDFTLATEAWQKYITGNVHELQQWIDENPFWGSMHLLKPALQAHVKRLQQNEDGLGYIEQKLLQLYKNGISSRAAVFEAFSNELPIYGMGDAEVDAYLNRLINKGLIALE
ncbi:DUF1835 domain-containing protein [Mucilaginibacter sp. PAMB04274]|uniref:DUF1835 domain-containing protein n=1 Tax=Mucilaginibacter sp. PAMB04274 TaxID=3138568 RepID=UPI0031F6FBE2